MSIILAALGVLFIGFSKAGSGNNTAIRASAAAKGLKADANDFRNVTKRVEVE